MRKTVLDLGSTSVYPNPEEIGNHMNEAQKWSGMGGLLQLFKDYDATLLMGG